MASSTPNSIYIRPYSPSTDFDSVLDHLLTHFRLESPLFSGLNFTSEEMSPFLLYHLDQAGKCGVSYVACDKNIINNSEVIGCVLASIEDREDPKWQKPMPIQLTTPKQKGLAKFVDGLFDGPLEEFAMGRVLKLDIMSVSPMYRKRGFCKRMVEMCLRDAAIGQSCDVALTLATSYKSQALMMAQKFITVKCCYFDQYNKRHENDEIRFNMKDPANTSAKVLAKILT